MNEEQRESHRVPVSFEARWETMSGRYAARVSDISTHGCFLETIGHAAIGEEIRFEIHLPTGVWLPLRGLIMYSDSNIGLGMRFTDLSDETRSVVAELIK